MTKGFEQEAEYMLKYVTEPDLVDLTRLPAVSYLEEMSGRDSKENKTHLTGICYAYEKRIERIRKLQIG